jgi:hypothetical protein
MITRFRGGSIQASPEKWGTPIMTNAEPHNYRRKGGALAGLRSHLESMPTKPETKPDAEDATIAECRARVQLTTPRTPEFIALKDMSLRFLDSPDAVTAFKNAHHTLSLFGVCKSDASINRVDCWGLVPFLAWGIHTGEDAACSGKICAIRTRSAYAVRQRPPQNFHFDQSVPWWDYGDISASPVLFRLRDAGVEMASANGQVLLKGPKPALTEDVLNEVQTHKEALIAFLSAEGSKQ